MLWGMIYLSIENRNWYIYKGKMTQFKGLVLKLTCRYNYLLILVSLGKYIIPIAFLSSIII